MAGYLRPVFLAEVIFLAACWGFSDCLKVPFRPKDVLPVLPRQISWPVLNTIHHAVDLLPVFVGTVSPEETIRWKGSCFYGNEARMEFTEKEGDKLGGGVLHIQTSNAHSWTCMDLYVFATPFRVTWDYYFTAREHTLNIEAWEEPAELDYVKKHGISVFLMPSGMLGTFLALWDVLPLFSNSVWGQNANIAFLKKHMGASFKRRSKPWIANINVDDIHSGDFLAVSKIRGRWGGFETLEKWVTGAYAGHTAVCLKDEEGKLWIGESGHENEKQEEVIVVIPWEEWWELQLKDVSNPHIALLPLHPDLRAKFNSTAAWAYARNMSGKPYGYHNMIFSWIDTITDNYPPPLDAHLVVSVMTMWTRIQPDYAANMWNEALNMRLGTKVVEECEVIVLGVKPQVVKEVLVDLKPVLSKDKLLISIAAGVKLKDLQEWAGNARVVRVMPNTPCLVGKTASAMSLGDNATSEDEKLVKILFEAVGKIWTTNEKLLDAVTGLSGSGPAYIYLAIEAMADGGVAAGLPRDLALSLASQTVLGAATMVIETKKHPGQLKDEVASPAGTTITGIHELEKGGLRATLMNAVIAAAKRSVELSKT